MNKDMSLQCPTCKSEVKWNDDFPQRPFCSKRCQLIDLGEWANESHKIAGSSVYEDMLSGDLEAGSMTGGSMMGESMPGGKPTEH